MKNNFMSMSMIVLLVAEVFVIGYWGHLSWIVRSSCFQCCKMRFIFIMKSQRQRAKQAGGEPEEKPN